MTAAPIPEEAADPEERAVAAMVERADIAFGVDAEEAEQEAVACLSWLARYGLRVVDAAEHEGLRAENQLYAELVRLFVHDDSVHVTADGEWRFYWEDAPHGANWALLEAARPDLAALLVAVVDGPLPEDGEQT